MYNLPTTQTEAAATQCEDITNGYMTLTTPQKKRWLKAASGPNGAIRLSQPAESHAIKINIWDDTAQLYGTCSWVDTDPFDLPT